MNSFIAKVKYFADGGTPILELPNGRFVLGDHKLVALSPKPGDVFISADNWEEAPSEVWQKITHVGRVQEIEGNSVILKFNEALFHRLIPKDLEVSQGQTVLFDEGPEILDSWNHMGSVGSIPSSKESIDSFRTELDPERFKWEAFAGSHETRNQAQDIVSIHANLDSRKKLKDLGIDPLRGVLFEGPPGTGKTFLAQIMAAQSGASFYLVTTASLGGRLVGESEERLEAIYEDAAKQTLSFIFIDEIEVLTKDRSGDQEHGSRLVNVFLTNMDGVKAPDNVITIGTTNRISDIDKALRRPGRFDREVAFRTPNHNDRIEILRSGSRKTIEPLDYKLVAEMTDGWTAADLEAIWQFAGELTVKSGRKAIFNDHFLMGYERAKLVRINRT